MGKKPTSRGESFRFKGNKLIGVFSRPERRGKVPAVLMLHGFPGSEKNVDIQRELLDRGIAAFTLHFAGAWGSGGLYRFTSLPDQAEAALDFLAAKKEIDAERLAVFGFSMGGWTALHVGARRPALRAVSAVAPVGGPEMVGPGLREFIAKSSEVLAVGSATALHKDFIRAVRTLDPAESVRRMRPALQIIHAADDEVVPFSVGLRLREAAGWTFAFVRASGGGHSFLDRRPWLTRRVTDFLSRRLLRR